MLRRQFLQSILTAPAGILGTRDAAAPASRMAPSAADRTRPLLVGVARIDITPTTPVCLEGYEDPATRISTGIHDRLYARAFAFSLGRRRLVWVCCDVASMTFGDYLRRPLVQALGLAAEELLLCAVHTHSGPLLTLHPAYPENVAYTQQLPGLLRRVATEAWRTRRPAHVAFGTARSSVGVSRRLIGPDGRVEMLPNPRGVVDPEVAALRVSAADGTALAAIFGYACHSRTLRAPNRLVSGDVLGLAEQDVERAIPGAVVAACAGASGDIDPAQVVDGFDADGGGPPVRLAQDLGRSVRDGLDRARRVRVDRLRSAALRAVLPPKHANQQKAVQVVAAALGDLAIVGLDCEASTEIGLAIKAASPFAATLVVTNCNGWSGYLPVSRQYDEGGYEVDRTAFGREAADQLVSKAVGLLRTL
jgi:hypothetical protein